MPCFQIRSHLLLMKPEPNRLTVEEAAAWLDMRVSTLRTRIKNREIAALKDGKGYLLEEADVEAYDQRRKVAAYT